jgi:hypothetical protein
MTLDPLRHGSAFLRALKDNLQRAFDQHAYQVPAIVGVAAHVADGLGRRLGQRRGPFDVRLGNRASYQSSAGLGNEERRRRDCPEGDTSGHASRPVVIERQRNAGSDDRNIHLIARDETQAGTAGVRRGRRQMQVDEHFARAEERASRSGAEPLDG